MNAALFVPYPSGDIRTAAPVFHGSLAVQARAEADFEAAAAYLSRDSRMRDVIERAEHLPHGLYLATNDRDLDAYDASSGTIMWDPHSALQTTSGGSQSPALGLGHELDHATVDPRLAAAGAATSDRSYGNAEERRVIRGSEAHAARVLGEAVRADHAGRPYRVDSPVAV